MLTQRVSWETKRVKCNQNLCVAFFWANTESSPPPPYKQIPTTKSFPYKEKITNSAKQSPKILNLWNKTEKTTTKKQNKIKITFLCVPSWWNGLGLRPLGAEVTEEGDLESGQVVAGIVPMMSQGHSPSRHRSLLPLVFFFFFFFC